MDNSRQLVLLIDGEEISSERLQLSLRPDYELVKVTGGVQADQMLEKYRGNVVAIVLNIKAPFNKSFSIFKKIKKHSLWKYIPFIVTTFFSDSIIDRMSFQLGAWDYLKLPEGLDMLQYRLEAAIERSQFSAVSELKYRNNYDMLTGIYNQERFFDKTRKMMLMHQEEFVFIRFDINRFKLYNSFFGKEEGDQLIKFIANRILSYIEDHDICTAGRIEADVFCLCMPNHADLIQDAFFKIKKALREYNENYDISPAFGLYVIEDNNMSMDKIYTNATVAAKQSKGNAIQYFTYYTADLEKDIIREQNIANEMSYALDNGQFIVYLQPKYNLKLERIEGAEALVRWLHPEKGMKSPAEFIPVFERNGFITKLDYYVWETVCQLIRKWLDEGRKVYPISVNISRVNIYNPQFVRLLTGLVNKYGISPKYLHLELTETTYMDNPDAMIEAIDKLQDFGFQILMDDFGSGYSSLNVLKDLEIDTIKIDMKFFETSKNEERAENIITAIIRMAKWLELPIVAEGVETKEQVDFLKSLGCEYVQGYYYSKPVPVEEYLFMLEHEKEYLEWVRIDGEQTKISPDEFLNSPMGERFVGSMLDGTALFEWNAQTGQIELIRADDGFFYLTDNKISNMDQKNYDLSFLEPSGLKLLNHMMEKSLALGEVQSGFFENVLTDGTEIYMEARLKCVASREHDHMFYLAFINLSNSKKRELKLKKENEILKSIIEQHKLEIGDYEGN